MLDDTAAFKGVGGDGGSKHFCVRCAFQVKDQYTLVPYLKRNDHLGLILRRFARGAASASAMLCDRCSEPIATYYPKTYWGSQEREADVQERLAVNDLGNYQQVLKGVRQNKIPFYDKFESPRLFKSGIDDWKKTPNDADLKWSNQSEFLSVRYRDKLMSEYTLNAIRRFMDVDAWNRVPAFAKKIMIELNVSGRPYIRPKVLDSQTFRYNDYFTIGFQLGLFDRKREEGETRYYPTEFSRQIGIRDSLNDSKEVIVDSILQIVKGRKETNPHERSIVLLLWYVLKIKEAGLEPQHSHFQKAGESAGNSIVRLEFARSLCSFLFNEDSAKESRFLNKWERYKERQFIALATVRK
jgi:hypothetical protein